MLLSVHSYKYQGFLNVSCGWRHIALPVATGISLLKHIKTLILLVCLFLIVTGCSANESKDYVGDVVDEYGKPISNVQIQVCYTGWKWKESGLIMDHLFCSKADLTDESGIYRIKFAAPKSAFLMARKTGWTQTRDFLAENNHVVLARMVDDRKRRLEQTLRKERENRKRNIGESDFEYYCRVIRTRADKVKLSYHDQQLQIFQTALNNDGLLLAVKGSYEAVKAMSHDLSVSPDVDGKRKSVKDFYTLPRKFYCDSDIFFIKSRSYIHPSLFQSVNKVNVRLASVYAAFTMSIWKEK